eukprot:gene2493-18157_t
MAASTTKLYCVCKSEYQPSQFMIECDKCKDWFHGRCVGVSENQATDIDVYHCPLCEQVHGTSTLKRRRSTQRRNYKELNNGIKPIFAGTIDFMKLLKTRKFDGTTRVDDCKPFRELVELIKEKSDRYLKHRSYVDNYATVFPLMKEPYGGNDTIADYLAKKNPQFFYGHIPAANIFTQRQLDNDLIEIQSCMKQHLIIFSTYKEILCKEYLCDCTHCLQFDFKTCLQEEFENGDEDDFGNLLHDG